MMPPAACSVASGEAFPIETESRLDSAATGSRHPQHVGRYRSGRQALPSSGESSIDNATRQLPAPQDQPARNALNQDATRLHVEIHQRFAPVLIEREDRG